MRIGRPSRFSEGASFDYATHRARGEAALFAPPPRPWIVRPSPRGERVAVFVLPLDCIQPQNRTRHMPGWALGELKGKIWRKLVEQHGEQRRRALPGRPMVRCIRFSSNDPDRHNDGFKFAIDALCLPGGRREHGIGFLRDDKPRDADVHQWWEPGPRNDGFGMIEVWTGDPTWKHGSKRPR